MEIKNNRNASQQGSMLLVFVFIGVSVALAFFLITFITTQKAQTPHPRSDLLIPIPDVPTIPRPTPRPKPSISLPSPTLIPSPIATQEAELTPEELYE